MQLIKFFLAVFFLTPLSPLAAEPFKVGFFPDNIFLSRTEETGLYQELLFFKQIGQTLVETGQTNELLPGIAEKWTISDDKKLYTFYLRKEITFHDGTPLTAHDVINSLNRNIYSNKNTLHYYLQNLKGYNEGWKNKKCAGLTANGDHQLLIHLNKPFSPLLKILSSGTTAIFKTPIPHEPLIGSGPYQVKKTKTNGYSLIRFKNYKGIYQPSIEEIQLVANNDYLYGKKTNPEEKDLPDFDAMIPTGYQSKYESLNYAITRTPNLGTIGFYPNTKSKDLNTIEKRTAILSLLYKVSKKMSGKISEKILGSFIDDLYPRGMFAHQSGRASWLALEKNLLANDLSALPHKLTIASIGQVLGSSEYFLKTAAEISKVKINIKTLNTKDLIENLKNENYDVLYLIWHSVISEPYSQLLVFDILSSFQKPQLQNFHRLIEQATLLEPPEEKVKKYASIADLVFHEALFLPIYQRDYLSALKSGYHMSKFFYRYQPMFSEIEKTAP